MLGWILDFVWHMTDAEAVGAPAGHVNGSACTADDGSACTAYDGPCFMLRLHAVQRDGGRYPRGCRRGKILGRHVLW